MQVFFKYSTTRAATMLFFRLMLCTAFWCNCMHSTSACIYILFVLWDRCTFSADLCCRAGHQYNLTLSIFHFLCECITGNFIFSIVCAYCMCRLYYIIFFVRTYFMYKVATICVNCHTLRAAPVGQKMYYNLSLCVYG